MVPSLSHPVLRDVTHRQTTDSTAAYPHSIAKANYQKVVVAARLLYRILSALDFQGDIKYQQVKNSVGQQWISTTGGV